MLKLAKRNYQSLGTFIRLVDYMVVETQVRINQESADLILEEMDGSKLKEKGTNRNYGIVTQIDFNQSDQGESNGMQFEPTQTEFVAQFEKLL